MNNRRFKPKSPKPKSFKPKSPILRRTPLVSNGIKYKDRLKAPSGPEMCVKLLDESNCKKPNCNVFNCKSGFNLVDYTSYIKPLIPCEANNQLYCEMDGYKVYCGCRPIKAIDKKCPDGYEMYSVRGGACDSDIRPGRMCPAILVTNNYCRKKTDGPTCEEQTPEDDNCVNPNCKMFKCKIGANYDNYRELISCDYNSEELVCQSKPGNSDKVYCKCIPNKARMTDFNDGRHEYACRDGWQMYDSLLLDGDCSFKVFPSGECTPQMYKLCRKNV